MFIQEEIQRRFMISVKQVADYSKATYLVTYIPRSLQQTRMPNKPQKKGHEYIARVDIQANSPPTWDSGRPEGGVTGEELDLDACHRAALVHNWLMLLSRLIAAVEGYGKELGWSTKQIEKPMEDSEIGKYTAPALLLQEETTKVLLEPIARSAPGTEGVVDLYVMPGYDDIATVYYYGHRWHLHYAASAENPVSPAHEIEAKALTKASLRSVLEELKTHAQ